MVRERKCILCHIVYSSKKEMDEHMRSMLHHRELENLRGRDSNHKCHVCRVTVVGLSAYAKHISSQLHKDQTDAYDRAQEGNEEAEEEYFDQELIQLINQKKEQSRPDEDSHASQEPETDDRRLRRKREERGPHGDRSGFDQAGWHHRGMPHHDWQWENGRFENQRKGNFPHATRNPNSSRYPSGPKGRASWHLNNTGNPAKRHHMLGNAGAAWHANTGSSTTWHHPGTGRNRNWNPESGTDFPTWHSGNSGGNWKSAPRGSNGWHDEIPPSRHRFDDMSLGWNTKRGRSINYNPMSYPWEQQDPSAAPAPYGDPAEEQSDTSLMDFTSDKLPSEGSFDFSVQDRAEPKTTNCSGKDAGPSRDKPHRWSPYPSQKAPDSQPATDDDAPEKDPSSLPFQSPQKISKAKSNNLDNFPKLSMNEDEVYPVKNHEFDTISSNTQESAGAADGRDLDQERNKSSTMPSFKSPLLVTLARKLSVQKRDFANATSNHKNLFHSSPREGRTRLNALNLETDQSNAYISKLRSASCRDRKCIKETVDISLKEPVESLSEVLRKAKEILQCSQSMRSQHLLEDQSEKATNTDLPESAETATELHMEFLENVSDGELSDFDVSEARSENPGLIGDTSSHSIAPHVDIGKKDCRNNGTSAKLSSTSVQIESSSHPVDNLDPSALESEGSEDLLKSDAQDDSECAKNSMANQDLKESSQQSLLPDLSKLGLPVSLQRDLTRHIGPKSKAGAHLPEPNLNIARRIRNVSGHRKSETDKESGLKPTLRQILNASRRNVNWEQVIHHVSKKKQELGKGLPRFGIEMVAPVQNDQEDLDLEEGHDLASFEGFHWEGMTPPGSARKRSLSESSVVVDRTAAVYDFFANQTAGRETEHRRSSATSQSCRVAVGPNANDETSSGAERKDSVDPSTSSTSEKQPAPLSSGRRHSSQSPIPTSFIKREDSIASLDKPNTSESLEDEHSLGPNAASSLPASNIIDLATDSSYTSGTEQNDSQSVRKKRRATADGLSPEITNLEQKSKRRKIKAKKERSQVDQLLIISLREEELSGSLQSLDTNLLQARAALQAAYVEVQHLMVMKQQITMEMSAMRTQRIQILQGLQETLEYPEHSDQPQEGILGERSTKLQDSPAPAADSSNSNLFSLFLDTPPSITPHTSPCGAALGTPLRVRTPPAFQTPSRLPNSAPDTSGPIKQERMSPPGGETDTLRHGSLLLPQVGPLLTPGKIMQNPSSCQNVAASLSSQTKGFPSAPEESGMDKNRHKLAENRPQQSSQNSRLEGNNSILEGASFGRRTSILQCPPLSGDASLENKNIRPLEQPEQQAESTMASVEDMASKKKKKLRKKKTLRAANVPDNSDTELDICCDPVRKVKSKRVPREGKVTTSTSCEQEEGSTALAMQRNENDSDSTVEVVEIADPIFEVLDIDSDCGKGKPDSPSKRDPLNSTEKRLLEIARSGYDEVSSTSEMGANYRNGVLRSVAETQTSLASVRSSKNSSEVSSEPGEEEDPTEGNFEGHQAAVNAIQIFEGVLYTCSADKRVHAYSLVSRKCVAIFEGHTSKVNCLFLTLTTGKKSALFTGSSDHTIRCYNTKTRECTDRFQLEDRVVCLHGRWRILFAGLANGSVVTFAIKSGKKLDTFECHGPRAVSCLATAQEGSRRLLLVGSYDCTISVRDARNGLLLRTLEGHSKTVLCMKVVNDLVFSGSSDQSVHAHNIHTGELVRIYKGHNHAVTVVNILGKVMVTASLDKFVRVYELQSHDRLQVYGGHTDMIMCMAIHKSMIYTGCYDGSIQAVRLNLMQNYRCWWHGCALIFGVVDHLKQHLLTDHTNPNFHTLKCRWKNCDAIFTARRGSKQDAPGHIERHAEDDSKIDT